MDYTANALDIGRAVIVPTPNCILALFLSFGKAVFNKLSTGTK